MHALSIAEERRLPAVGRARALGLHRVPGVVLARVTDHGSPEEHGHWLPPGAVVLEVWVRADLELAKAGKTVAAALAERVRQPGLLVVPVVRHAGRWHRAVAWWRRLWWTDDRPTRVSYADPSSHRRWKE